MKIIVIDTESTGLTSEDRIIEVGSTEITQQGGILASQSHYTATNTPISIEAMAVHNITPEKLVGAATIDEVIPEYLADVYIAQNAPFDKRLFKQSLSSENYSKMEEAMWIDTLKISKNVFPELKSHKNMYLYYYFELYKDHHFQGEPHRAGYDSSVTATLVRFLCKHLSCDVLSLKDYEDLPFEDRICHMKKHKGKRWKDVLVEDKSYLQWMYGVGDLMSKNPDLKEWLDEVL